MANWRRRSTVAAALALVVLCTAASVSAESETSVHIKVHQVTEDKQSGASGSGSKDCEVSGVTLSHRSMHYYGENAYVACSNGRAGCYLIERVHDKASQVACPTENFQQKLDDEAAFREHEKLAKQAEDGEVDEDEDEDESEDEDDVPEGHRRLSLAVVSKDRLWDNGVVCYQLNSDYPFNSTQKSYIYEAMSKVEASTNVRFVPTATCEDEEMSYCSSCENYVDFKHPSSGRDCNSSIGVTTDGAQVMNLADRCFEVDDELKTVYGSAMHEIGHSLGLYHEHQHPQRTIGVFWDDIDQSVWSEMSIRDVSVGGAYDIDSIMHYPMSYGFCQPVYCSDTVTTNCVDEGTTFCNLNDDDDCVDITQDVCDETTTEGIGQRKYLSDGDLAAINELYDSAAWTVDNSRIEG